jgi:hypothetical protein
LIHDAMLYCLLLVVSMYAGYINAEFTVFPAQQQNFEHPNPDYLLPNGHRIRTESEEEEEFYMKRPLVEHPFYQKQPTPPVYTPPEFQHRLIDDEFFNYVPKSGTVCVV